MSEDSFIQGILQFNEPAYRADYGLVRYGIFEEDSDIRAHVSDKRIFVFKTTNGVEAINKYYLGKTDLIYAKQPNYIIPTGAGYLVKHTDITDLRILKYESWEGWDLWDKTWGTSLKGKWAVDCVRELLKIGRFPLWIEARQTNDVKIDIEGTDILITMNQKIQVKCDYPAVKTGNLYLQTHESNPYKIY
ncbi:MAG: hypothetical protein ABFC18_03335 [Rikenellaceae bacterium]